VLPLLLRCHLTARTTSIFTTCLTFPCPPDDRNRRGSWLLARHDRELWLLTVAFFFAGDLLTTGLGVASGQIAEAGPLGAPIIGRYGIYGMVALKLGVLGLSYFAWKLVAHPERIGIPLGLATIGVLVTLWNAFVLSSVHW